MAPPIQSAFEVYNRNQISKKVSKKKRKISNFQEEIKVKNDIKKAQKLLKLGGNPDVKLRKKKKKSKEMRFMGQESNPSSSDCEENDEVGKKQVHKVATQKKKQKQSKDKEIEEDANFLDGDDVPLVEEMMEEMVSNSNDVSDDDGESGSSSGADSLRLEAESLGLNGDNFMSAVLSSNSHMMEQTSKKTSKKRKSTDSRQTKPITDKKRLKKARPDLSKVEKGSEEMAREYLEWIIKPMKIEEFLKEKWESGALHIKREQKNYYKELFSTKVFDAILREQNVIYGKNLDVTSYDGKRETHNPSGRAYPPVVWDFYNNGCSLRMLNPQTFHEPVWKACATLQELFGSMVGANIYLTPPGTQGFAPHYDDVEVFILQLEGSKRWRLYEPRNKNQVLPRFSSPNFDEADIGEPYLDIILNAGDMLYFPRGTIHQGNCLDTQHSLHITISCHQLNSFGDLLQKLVPQALEAALSECEDFRKGLPWDYLNFMGVVNTVEDNESVPEKRKKFLNKIKKLMGKLFEYASIDAAVDQMGKRLMHDSLPPYLTNRENDRTVGNDGEKWHVGKSRVVNRVEIDPDTEIRLIRKHCMRMLLEGNEVNIYYNVDNTREYHQMDEMCLEIDSDAAPAVETLIKSYPNFIKAEDLPLDGLDEKMQLIQVLWEKKLIITRNPLESHYDD